MDAHAAELVVIDLAVSKLLYSIQCGGTGPPITIFTDSPGALQALRNPHARSGQFLLTQITLKVHEINTSNQSSVTLEWSWLFFLNFGLTPMFSSGKVSTLLIALNI